MRQFHMRHSSAPGENVERTSIGVVGMGREVLPALHPLDPGAMARAKKTGKKPRATPAAKKKRAQKAAKAPRSLPTNIHPRTAPQFEEASGHLFSDSPITQQEVDQTIEKDEPTAEEIRPYNNKKSWQAQDIVLRPEDVPDRARQLKEKRELRVINAFTFWKFKGNDRRSLRAPVPIAGEDMLFFELMGMVASLNGPYRFCAMAGELKVDYPLRDACPIWIKHGEIECIGMVADPNFRDSQPYLAVTTRDYIYFLVTPACFFEREWRSALTLWAKYLKHQGDLCLSIIDYRSARPQWWRGLRSWNRYKRWKRRWCRKSKIRVAASNDKTGDVPREGDIDDSKDSEFAGSNADSQAPTEGENYDSPVEEDEADELAVDEQRDQQEAILRSYPPAGQGNDTAGSLPEKNCTTTAPPPPSPSSPPPALPSQPTQLPLLTPLAGPSPLTEPLPPLQLPPSSSSSSLPLAVLAADPRAEPQVNQTAMDLSGFRLQAPQTQLTWETGIVPDGWSGQQAQPFNTGTQPSQIATMPLIDYLIDGQNEVIPPSPDLDEVLRQLLNEQADGLENEAFSFAEPDISNWY
ncbi:hypothetical protein RSAG8_09583, partial [Rhizoctonia solani AG-8 WAC10335]